MLAIQEPLVAISLTSNSVSQIQSELTSFGLNPHDWRALHVSQSDHYKLILVHRDDEDLRLAVNVRNNQEKRTNSGLIQDLEMIVL